MITLVDSSAIGWTHCSKKKHRKYKYQKRKENKMQAIIDFFIRLCYADVID